MPKSLTFSGAAARALTSLDDALAKVGVGLPPAKTPLPEDPWRFILECCYSYDELAKTLGMDPRRRFPDKPYLQAIVREWQANPRLRVEKSRQIMVTWLLAALWLHWVLTNPGQRVAWICKTFADASDHLQSRVFYIYENIPATYLKPAAEFVEGEFRVFHDSSSTIPTSRIEAIAAERGSQADAASQLRSFTYSGVYWDEAAFQSGQDEVYAAGLPCVGAGGRFNVCSSANGRNFFWRLGHGKLDDESVAPVEQTIEAETLLPGVSAWQLNGFHHLRVHFTADPDKNPQTATGRAWFEAVRPSYSSRKWAREMEIDFEVPLGQPVFTETEKLIEVGQFHDPQLPVVSGFDYSFLANVCLSGQIHKRTDGKYSLHILTEVVTEGTTIEVFGREVLRERARIYPSCHEFSDFGDYSAQTRTSTGVIAEEMQRLGITLTTVPTGPGGVLKGISIVQRLISTALLEVDPGCVMLLRTLRAGYVWDTGKIDGKGLPVPSAEHPYSDVADALRYLCVNLFELQEMPGGGEIAVVKNQYRGPSSEQPSAPARPFWRPRYADDDPEDGGGDVIPQGQFRG